MERTTSSLLVSCYSARAVTRRIGTDCLGAGCYVSLKNNVKAAELFEAIPALLDKKKIGGKDLPTEVWIRKKRTHIVPIHSPRLNLTAMHSDLLQGEAEATDGLRGRLCPMHEDQPCRGARNL